MEGLFLQSLKLYDVAKISDRALLLIDDPFKWRAD